MQSPTDQADRTGTHRRRGLRRRLRGPASRRRTNSPHAVERELVEDGGRSWRTGRPTRDRPRRVAFVDGHPTHRGAADQTGHDGDVSHGLGGKLGGRGGARRRQPPPLAARPNAPRGAALESAPEPAIAARRFRWPGGGARRGRRWKSPGPKLMGTPFVGSTTRPRRSRRPSRATPITTSPPSMEPRGSHGTGANRATLIRRTIPSIMARDSAIEWTGHTFNPWWGCTKVSPACDHCYAETWARRTGFDIWGANTPRRHLSDDYWSQPLRWDRAAAQSGRRARVFCASMADVFEWNRTLARIIREGVDSGRDTRASVWYKCSVYKRLATTEAPA